MVRTSGQWSVVSGQWSVVSGQWSVVSGQWSVVSGQQALHTMTANHQPLTTNHLVVGVLAVQGDFAEHAVMLRRAAHEQGRDVVVREVRTPRDLDDLDGLIVPGGESTTMGKLLVAYGLEEPIRAAAQRGLPVWGTCAGMILLAREILGGEPDARIGLMDMMVHRNAFGRQIDSFE